MNVKNEMLNYKMPTYKQQFLKKYNLPKDTSLSKSQISRLTKIPMTILNKVYDRGIGAYKNNPRSVRIKGTFKKNSDLRKYPMSKRLSAQQWAMARIYSFVMKGKTYKTADADLARKIK